MYGKFFFVLRFSVKKVLYKRSKMVLDLWCIVISLVIRLRYLWWSFDDDVLSVNIVDIENFIIWFFMFVFDVSLFLIIVFDSDILVEFEMEIEFSVVFFGKYLLSLCCVNLI